MASFSDKLKIWKKRNTLISPEHSTDATEKSAAKKANGSSVSTDDDIKDIENEKSVLMQLRKDGALNQCINELSSNLRRCVSELPENNVKSGDQESPNRRNSHHSDNKTVTTPSHFVTVIEVKENVCSELLEEKKILDNDSEKDIVNDGDEKKEKEKDKIVSQPLAAVLEARKKVPPRPPPKYIRRAAPVEPPTVPTVSSSNTPQQLKDSDSPSSSLERNIKPSEILRQKSSDALDVKVTSAYRRTAPDVGMHSISSELADEFGRKVIKAESLEKNRRPDAIKRTHSPTGSTGKAASNSSPTGSLNKFGTDKSTDSPTGSLGKANNKANENVGSKESLTSHGLISERMKSYESISSLSSDSMKVGLNVEHEPYYDTVPMDNGDGDYVYIQAGGTGSTSSRDDVSNVGSTLPLPSNPKNFSSQTSILTEPESPGRSSNYVNIDYFLSQSHETRSSSIDSDGETSDTPALMRAISHDEQPSTPGMLRKLSGEGNRSTLIRHIITSIIASETLYVECLNKMMQYMKAIKATLTTSQPVISEEEFQTMFFKIDELYTVHTRFLSALRQKVSQVGDILVGETFRELAGHINLYGAFLHNYGRAIDTVKKCGSNNQQFKEIVSNIILNSQNEQSLTLEDLLHKPVARVQKNALVLQDLLNETPQTHPDYLPLKQSQKMIRNFLSEFNFVPTKNMIPSEDKALRRLIKNSFIVELAEGNRKLRHLFLFNDVIACAKYKSSGRDRFEYELKWFIALKDIIPVFLYEEAAVDPKENSPVNILHLKSQACIVRDQIIMEEKDEKKQKSYGSRAGDKHKKKLYDIEAQLVLASPNLVFRIGDKAKNKTWTFFLSSDFERTQWIESIMSLQQSCNLPGAQPVSIYDLQAWIAACQTMMKTEMGSYLLRNSRDESLLVGDLHLTLHGVTGLESAADFFICVEVDSYGHYFRKAKTKLVCRSANPVWNESFIVELEGSQNVRFLLYEDHSGRQILRAKHVIQLSRKWLKESVFSMPVKLSDSLTLSSSIRFVPGEVSLRRVPTSKPGALFGAKMQQVLKREKRNIPFIISACIREVERRGMYEIGVYRVSGSASDLAKLKKSFETNNYEAEQLLKEVDIHSVTGILKSYLRELPEALFTDLLYPKLFDIYNKYSNFNETGRIDDLQRAFAELPEPNRESINFILDHLIRVHQQEAENKMSLHNLAMVFGPTLLRPGPHTGKHKDGLESSTVDVMAQAGILYCFLSAKK
ncbi:active breakpoint cluster region-related protein isoform X2 [Bradysia coprophila]|uniref:active breakpoint cluster region-related protein isoform X2 n=1 Tax=Bradysia coprophila TaxID=38358 RepID=UPI00187DBB68|nr:active breakpoint cluster region-related protein isoform X2 [Bradysia coprophila]